ncbi:MAG: thiol:disulfide interchange protein DsbA/DsbL [Thauera sp.]|jgi:thiol:disulfide interchange protein DsbA
MNRRDALKLAGLAFALPAASIARADEPFQIIEPAQKADDPSKIEVLEFFHYGCPHCRDFHPLITAWKKKLPADVAFRAVPAVWNNAQLGGLARLYYTAEITGDLAALEPAIFAAVQDDKRPLFNEQQVGEWIAGKVGDAAKFLDTYKSFGVGSLVQRADQLARAMKIQGVPALVIGGRYMTSASLSGSHENTLKVADDLIARVRKEREGK